MGTNQVWDLEVLGWTKISEIQRGIVLGIILVIRMLHPIFRKLVLRQQGWVNREELTIMITLTKMKLLALIVVMIPVVRMWVRLKVMMTRGLQLLKHLEVLEIQTTVWEKITSIIRSSGKIIVGQLAKSHQNMMKRQIVKTTRSCVAESVGSQPLQIRICARHANAPVPSNLCTKIVCCPGWRCRIGKIARYAGFLIWNTSLTSLYSCTQLLWLALLYLLAFTLEAASLRCIPSTSALHYPSLIPSHQLTVHVIWHGMHVLLSRHSGEVCVFTTSVSLLSTAGTLSNFPAISPMAVRLCLRLFSEWLRRLW